MSREPGFKFQKFLFFALFTSNFRKSYQIWGKLAQERKSHRQKTNRGWKTPPSPYRVKQATSSDSAGQPLGLQGRNMGVIKFNPCEN